jgi:hypothetical protein
LILPASSGAGALVKVIRLTVFAWSARYFSIAFWVSARLPATSMTLIVCGNDGSAGACAQAGVARASATKSAAALCVVVTEWLPRILFGSTGHWPNRGRR